MSEFIIGLLKVVMLIFLYGVAGYLLLFSFSKNKEKVLSYYTIFMSLFVGLSSVVSLTALYLTKGLSVNIILLFVMGHLIYSVRRNNAPIEPVMDAKYNIPLVTVFVGVILLYSYCFFVFRNSYGNGDYVFYSKISYYLFKTGFENDYHIFNLLDNDYNNVTPYHYFELWLNAIHYFFWNTQNNLDTFLIITDTILIVSLFSGFLAVYELYMKVNIKGILLSFFIIFFGGFFFPFFNKILFLQSFEYCFKPYSVIHTAKFAPTILYFLAAFISLKKTNILNGLLLFSSCAVISVVTSAGIIFALSFLLMSVIIFKKFRQDFPVKYLLISFFPIIGVAAFYMIFGNKLVVRGGTDIHSISQLLIHLFSFAVLKQKINIIAGSIIVFISVYFFLFPLLFDLLHSAKNGSNKNEVLFISLVFSALAGGVLAWSILSPKCNAIQPFYFILQVIPLPLFILICSNRSSISNTFITVLILCFSILNLYNALIFGLKDNTKLEYKKQYELIAQKNNISGMVGSMLDSSEYINVNSYQSTCFSIGMPFMTHVDSLFCISLSDCSIPITNDKGLKEIYQEGIRLGAFYRFVQKQQASNTFRNVEASQIDFIKKYNIKYLIITDKVKLSSDIKAITDTIIPMPLKGEKIVLLKY